MSKSLIIMWLDQKEVEVIIGAADSIHDYSVEELGDYLLDRMEVVAKEKDIETLHTALLGIGIVFRKRFMEIILQVDKDKLTPGTAMLLASIKGKHQIEEKES